MEIFPGVHWLDLKYVNVFLVEGESGLGLIDSGPPGQANKILDYVHGLGRASGDITHLFITHADWDHAGSAAELLTATGATALAGAGTAALLQAGRSPKHLPRLLQWLADRLARYQALPAVQTISEGEELPFLQGLEMVAAPGHTADHHALYSRATGVLFAGDALNTRKGKLNVSPPRITADQEAARRSARRLLALAPVLIACGHGQPLQGHDKGDVLASLQKL